MRWVVDSISDGVAAVILESGATAYLPAWLLPTGARGGDALRVTREAEPGVATLRIEIDHAATDEAARAARSQLGPLAAGDRGGDIDL